MFWAEQNKATVMVSKQAAVTVSVPLKDSNVIYTASGQLFWNNKFSVASASHSPCMETFLSRSIYRFSDDALCKNGF